MKNKNVGKDIKKEALEMARYFIINDATIEQTAKAFDMGIGTAHSRLRVKLKEVDPELYDQVDAIVEYRKDKNLKENFAEIIEQRRVITTAEMYVVVKRAIKENKSISQVSREMKLSRVAVSACISRNLERMDPELYKVYKKHAAKVLGKKKAPLILNLPVNKFTKLFNKYVNKEDDLVVLAKYMVKNKLTIGEATKLCNLSATTLSSRFRDDLPKLNLKVATELQQNFKNNMERARRDNVKNLKSKNKN